MRKTLLTLFIVCALLGGASALAYASSCSDDSMIDKIGDWAYTFRKKGMEKDQILAKRKASRMLACAKAKAKKAARDTQKSVEQTKKQLGL